MNCKLFQQAAYEGSVLGNYPPALYVGVTNGPNVVTDLTGRLIALLTGTQVPLAKEECKNNQTDLVLNAFFFINQHSVFLFLTERSEKPRKSFKFCIKLNLEEMTAIAQLVIMFIFCY